MEAKSRVLLDAQVQQQEELMEAAAVREAERRSMLEQLEELRQTVEQLKAQQQQQQLRQEHAAKD